jgi:hypothetical protein
MVCRNRQFGDAIWSCMHTWELCPSSARMLETRHKDVEPIWLTTSTLLWGASSFSHSRHCCCSVLVKLLYGTKMRILGLCPAFRTYTTSCWHFWAEKWIWCDVCAIFVTSPDWAREVQRGLDLTFTLQRLSVVADIFFPESIDIASSVYGGCERSMCKILAQPNLVANTFNMPFYPWHRNPWLRLATCKGVVAGTISPPSWLCGVIYLHKLLEI